MKKNYLLFLTVVLSVLITAPLVSQHWVVNQVIVGSGGDWSNPDDFVTIASYNPGNGVTTIYGNIQTQSIQDIVINEHWAYVAAQDSIVKFNIDTYEKVVAIEAFGVSRLLLNNDVLLASFQYPETENFTKVYSAEDLTLVTNISEISGEAAGLLVVGELAYVAVPGGWASTVGSIAIISMLDYSLVDEINFDTLGRGIFDLFYYDNKIMSVNISSWDGTTGFISVMNIVGSHTESHFINRRIDGHVGVKDDLLFIVMNGAVGSIDLSDFSVSDTAVINAPVLTIAGAVIDTINNLFYITTTDYATVGEGTIYNFQGEETGSFEAGISANAIAIDYRDNTSINELYTENKIKIYPNPSNGVITVEVMEGMSYDNFKVTDISGRVVIDGSLSFNSAAANIDISKLGLGLYFLVLTDNNVAITSPFVKK